MPAGWRLNDLNDYLETKYRTGTQENLSTIARTVGKSTRVIAAATSRVS